MTEQAVRTAAALAMLLGGTLAVMSYARLGIRRELLVAAARALVQLIAVAAVIAWIFSHPQWSVLYLAIMVCAAAYTANRRIGGDARDRAAVLGAIALGSGSTVAIVAITGAVDISSQALLPFAAQMIGGAMAAAAVAGLRLRDDVTDQLATFEGYVALGATYRQAGAPFARRATERTLLPGLDQTKSAGLVTLPGAFVGLLIGGASPLTAAQIQLLVLLGLLLVQVVTAVTTTRLISPIPRRKPASLVAAPASSDVVYHPADVIVLDDVSVSRGSTTVVAHVSMTVRTREITAIVGPSGVGKSTLLRVLNRLTDIDAGALVAGSARFNGADVDAAGTDVQALRRSVGMVFQRPNVFPLSIFDNVAYGLRLEHEHGDAASIVQECLERAGLWSEVRDHVDDSAIALSIGQQQRLVIARCLAMEPDVILMDEPTSALDPVSTAAVEHLMRDLARDHTIVLVSHNLEQVRRVADRIAYIDRVGPDGAPGPGRLIEFGTAEAVLMSPRDPRTHAYFT
ncbi:MAG: ABC transporter permease [bacterium]|nr:ABC transporter permease [bacterium]